MLFRRQQRHPRPRFRQAAAAVQSLDPQACRLAIACQKHSSDYLVSLCRRYRQLKHRDLSQRYSRCKLYLYNLSRLLLQLSRRRAILFMLPTLFTCKPKSTFRNNDKYLADTRTVFYRSARNFHFLLSDDEERHCLARSLGSDVRRR